MLQQLFSSTRSIKFIFSSLVYITRLVGRVSDLLIDFMRPAGQRICLYCVSNQLACLMKC